MAERKHIDNIVMENARIIFRNFSGKEGKYNPPGKKSFCVILDNELADHLKDDGWNIKYLRPRDDDDGPTPYLPVAVAFEFNPPKIWLVNSKGRTLIDEGEEGMLDWAEIENVDLVIRPYVWEVNDKTGVKAYLKSLFVKVVEDDLEKKYADVPENVDDIIKDMQNLPFQ